MDHVVHLRAVLGGGGAWEGSRKDPPFVSLAATSCCVVGPGFSPSLAGRGC